MPVVKSPIFQCPVKTAAKVLPKSKLCHDPITVRKTAPPKEKTEKK
jgi:hypothetical protein